MPGIFSDFFNRNSDIHEYNTRIADHFHIPAVKTDLGKTGIKYRGAVIWNIIVSKANLRDLKAATGL